MKRDPPTDPLDSILLVAHKHDEVLLYRLRDGKPAMSLVRREQFDFLHDEKSVAGGIHE